MKIASKASTTIQKSGFRNKAFGAYAIIIMILTIIIAKDDKKDAALCLLPKELEGTDLGVAAAAQAFK